jgi:hypothetical protein
LIIVDIAVLLIFLDFPFASVVQIVFKHLSSFSIAFIRAGSVLKLNKMAKADAELTPGI